MATQRQSLLNDHGLLAKPVHLQRLERALRLEPFLNHVENIFKQASDLDDDSASDELAEAKLLNDSLSFERTDPLRLYNFSKVKKERKWLKSVLLSDSSDSDTSLADLPGMLRLHKMQSSARQEFRENPDHLQHFLSMGVLSNYDNLPEPLADLKECKRKKPEKKSRMKRPKLNKVLYEDQLCSEISKAPPSKRKSGVGNEATMVMKRRRIWMALSKKEIGRAQKQRASTRKDIFAIKKKACLRECRRTALASQKACRENPGKARRLTREMLVYWKKHEKVEKEVRRKAEREAQELQKHNLELLEARRQQRKLNFLITQTELYGHFLSRKADRSESDTILRALNEEPDILDTYDSDFMKALALKNVEAAFTSQQSKVCTSTTYLASHLTSSWPQVTQFDQDYPARATAQEESGESSTPPPPPTVPTVSALETEELPAPQMFVGQLKSYQLKGMTWLCQLYEKGINGILADEMGLGKTVQTIAFLASLVEVSLSVYPTTMVDDGWQRHGLWGPFLVVAPASTLHNWQQEFTKFVPQLKVLPYWGNAGDRRVLRQLWSQQWHVVVTSYQLATQDARHLQRVPWHYLVLDEAQAIKCSHSSRWQVLRNFRCRNRLLLTGTPIQNNMAELRSTMGYVLGLLQALSHLNILPHSQNVVCQLWSLLHFIMPTLFDSHTEFDEWFSKDIESHPEKSAINERHLSRLHMILKPFMLRRIKKDVENELSDKIEILRYCQQTRRQKQLTQALRDKICLRDLLTPAASQSSSLLNLVMQFRKVCNHPDLLEKRDVGSPFLLELPDFYIPGLLFNFYLESLRRNPLLNLLLTSRYIHNSLFHNGSSATTKLFSFSRLLDLSPSQVCATFLGGPLVRLRQLCRQTRRFLLEDVAVPTPLSQETFHSRRLFGVAPPPALVPPRHLYSSTPAWSPISLPRRDTSFLLHGPRGPPTPSWRTSPQLGGLLAVTPPQGWSHLCLPGRESLVTDSGKLQVLDLLLKDLKANGHRVLVYSQMTRMIDILEEYMWLRKHTYIRLDGSSKISERRDMVADFQSRNDIFVFLLSTRAGGLGLNLTAADTVIFYDSDWNPTVDQQAMDRAHRLGQTKQVTVYRLVCAGTVEERILQRARQKSQVSFLFLVVLNRFYQVNQT
ncbi:INO80 [Cordylochernes scorpioides]|uniref:Chromatin-remodeling ATPase INO80 n=1 Tax=Cordylochernes scorpioides TaxID=51811 RepID=A0ABY6KP96_9ARAC|nr:INO80 [Cordylochernes scorpioides]